MFIEILVGAALFGGGFGLGRVKNAAKLKAVSTVIANAEAKATTEVKALIAEVKSHL